MRLVLAAAALVGLFVLSTAGAAITDMCKEEIRARVCRLPGLLIRMAALWLPCDVRKSATDEWNAELDHVLRRTDGLPVTRLVRGIAYGSSLLLRGAPVMAVETGQPPWRRMRARPGPILELFWHGGAISLFAAIWWPAIFVPFYSPPTALIEVSGTAAFASGLWVAWHRMPWIWALPAILLTTGCMAFAMTGNSNSSSTLWIDVHFYLLSSAPMIPYLILTCFGIMELVRRRQTHSA